MGADEEPTDSQVQEIRDRITSYIEENGDSMFDSRDVEALMSNDYLVKRYFMHVFEQGGDQLEHAVNMVINSFKFRKEMGMRDITEDDLPTSLKEKGVMFMHNRDKDGKRLLIFDVKKHFKGKEKVEDMKTLWLYYLERIDREENGGKLTFLYDCSGGGIRNLDMDLMQFSIAVLKDYTPYNLHNILVYDMPWVLNAAWKIIKGWLPAGAAKKIKFVTKSTFDEYVSADQRFVAWGGDDEWEYRFEPELRPEKPSAASALPADTPPPTYSAAREDSSRKAKGHFETRVDSNGGPDMVLLASNKRQKGSVDFRRSLQSQDSFQSSVISRNSSFTSNPSFDNGLDLLSLNPAEEVVFTQNPQGGEMQAKFQIQNIYGKSIVFKIRTTSAEKFRVRPSMSTLSPGSSATIEIILQSSQVASAVSLSKDKFLITAVVVDRDDLNRDEITKVMKSGDPQAHYRLRCFVASSPDSPPIKVANHNVSLAAPKASPPPAVAPAANSADKELAKKLDALTKKVTSLVPMTTELRDQVAFLKTLLFVALALISLLIVIVFWRTAAQTCSEVMNSVLTDELNSPPNNQEL